MNKLLYTGKNSLLLGFSLLVMLLFGACQDDDKQDLSGNAEITVTYPEAYNKDVATGVVVKATNDQNGQSVSATTDEKGVALFTNLQIGTYSFRAEQHLDEEAAAKLTGTSSELFLNAIAGNIVVESAQTSKSTLLLNGAALSGLVFKEVYYTGSKTPKDDKGIQDNYFSDQFIEIYNNSDEAISLDGLCIADAYGNSGNINSGDKPGPLLQDKDHVYLSNVWRIPGKGNEHMLAPGKSIIIAQDGVNHKELNPGSPVDFSHADWETYNQRPDGRDADNPDVPNLERLYFTGGFDWLITVFGPSVVIFRVDDFDALAKTPDPDNPDGEWLDPIIKLPTNLIIDSFESLMDANSGAYKRIPVAINSGFVYATDTYTGESFRRKVTGEKDGRKVLQNTNNSGNDFEKLATPTPRSFN